MIQQAFRPASLEEAVDLRSRETAIYLAGGTLVNWAPAGLDTKKVILLEGLLEDSVVPRDDGVVVGAGLTLQALKDAPGVPSPLRRAAGFIPSRCVRNMATLGGNIAANRSDSYVIPALIALSAEVETVERGRLSVEAYVTGPKDALITHVILPRVAGACVVDRVVLSSAAYPTLTLAVRLTDGEAVIALGCVAEHVFRLREVEEALMVGRLATQEAVFNAVAEAVSPPAGLKESAAYRRFITATMVSRAVTACRESEGIS